jgi:putative transposase
LSQSLSKIVLHIVFSTKHREPLILKKTQSDLHAYLAGICRTIGSNAYRIGGTDNHIHLACSLPRTLTVSKLLEELKKASSAWIKKQDPRYGSFSWQSGYGVFSIGQSQLAALMRYIDSQQEHHRTRTFKEELLDLLETNGVEYHEKYLFT